MLLDRVAAYWDRRAEGYSMTVHEELAGPVGAFFEDALRDALPPGDGLACLDMGCGPGFFTILLNRLGHRPTSADYSLEMLERARANCAEAGYAAHTVQADAQALPFGDAAFDFVCSRNLVWDLERPERAYAEWLRVLKPGGRLLVCDGNHYLHYYNADYRTAWERDDCRTHDTRGVDPKPIDDIARDLPLSRQLRPEWDVATLSGMGLADIRVSRYGKTFLEPLADTGGALTMNFILRGTKTL